MKYEACFRANNFSICSGMYGFANKKQAVKEIREMAEGNRFAYGDCSWNVYNAETGVCVAAGGMTPEGRRYRLKK